MSLVEDLADQLRVASEELPIAQVSAAAERLRMASGLLAWIMHTSTNPTAVPTLGNATEHLDHATGALLVAQSALADYVGVLGMPRDGVPVEDPRPATALTPSPPPQTATGGSAELADWWADRVGQITEGPAAGPADDAARTSADLLHRCTASVLDDDRDRLRRELAGAGPAVGLGLAAVTPPLVRHLAAEIVGHPPRLEDLARVRRAALPLIAPMLPSMPADVAEELLARACHAKPQRQADAPPAHPVDSAAAGAVLVAALLRDTGRTAEDLAKVTEDVRNRADGEQERATLRLADGDDMRRRSAVDELADRAVRA